VKCEELILRYQQPLVFSSHPSHAYPHIIPISMHLYASTSILTQVPQSSSLSSLLEYSSSLIPTPASASLFNESGSPSTSTSPSTSSKIRLGISLVPTRVCKLPRHRQRLNWWKVVKGDEARLAVVTLSPLHFFIRFVLTHHWRRSWRRFQGFQEG